MKYRIRPYGFTTGREGLEVPEYQIERGERNWLFFFPTTDWTTVAWTTNPEDFEKIIKEDTLKRAREARLASTKVRYARTTLYVKSVSDDTPLEAVVHHL
jgi:hypothetical protein